jgi:hypothetical protein
MAPLMIFVAQPTKIIRGLMITTRAPLLPAPGGRADSAYRPVFGRPPIL